VVLVLAVAIGAIKLVQKQIEKMTGKVGVPVAVETVGTGSLMQQVELSGRVASEECKSYFAAVTAKVAACDIKAGDIVKSGEQLMSFDVADLEQQLEEQKLQQKQAKLGADITITNVNDTQQKAAEAATNFEEAEQ
jgi:multidrug efflux pump subunit AcrA (membrane-fusion protein)